MVGWYGVEGLSKTAGPSNCRVGGFLVLSETEGKFFCVLGQESGASLEIFRLAKCCGFDGYGGANGVTVAFVSAQTEDDRIADAIHCETQDSDLRRISIFEYDFQPAVAIEIGEREGPAIVAKIQSHHAGDIGKSAVAIVGKENVPL